MTYLDTIQTMNDVFSREVHDATSLGCAFDWRREELYGEILTKWLGYISYIFRKCDESLFVQLKMIWTEYTYKMPLSHKRRCYTAQADVFTIATGDENELHGEILTERLG